MSELVEERKSELIADAVTEITDATEAQSVKDRLEGAFDVMIEQAQIPSALIKVATALFTSFMNNTDEDEMIALLTLMRDQLLPYILEGDNK